MTINGHVENGRIVLDESVPLTEGMKVRIELLRAAPEQPSDAEHGPTLNDILKPVIGVVIDLPSDYARNHDHYLHGQPKK